MSAFGRISHFSTLPDNVFGLLQAAGFNPDPTEPLLSFSGNTYAHLVCGTFKSKTAVAKLIHLEKATFADYRKRFLPRDQAALKTLQHRSLVQLYDSKHLPSNKMLLLMEHCPGGSLCDLLVERRPVPLSEETARQLYCQIGGALEYMHNEGFAHRNVKCEKVLLDETRSVAKLADYGLTRSCFRYNPVQPLLDEMDTFCASASYVAPEVLAQDSGGVKQQPYNQFSADVWSIGVVLYAMVHAGLPFRQWNLRLWIEQQRAAKYELDKERLTPALAALIADHLNPNPNSRPTIGVMLEHRWCKTEKLFCQE